MPEQMSTPASDAYECGVTDGQRQYKEQVDAARNREVQILDALRDALEAALGSVQGWRGIAQEALRIR